MTNDELEDFWSHVYSPAVKAVLSQTKDARLDKWPPTRDAAEFRCNPHGRNAGITQVLHNEEVPGFLRSLRWFSESRPRFKDMFFYTNAQYLKLHSSRATPAAVTDLCLPCNDVVDYNLLFNMEQICGPQDDCSGWIDVAIEIAPPRSPGSPSLMALWRFDQLNQCLGHMIGGTHCAGGAWSSVDLYAQLARVGGIRGHASAWATEALGVQKMVFYHSNKYIHYAQTERKTLVNVSLYARGSAS